jgi:hypothetical protein
MKKSAALYVLAMFILMAISKPGNCQSEAAEGNCTVSGQVKMGGKPVAGIAIVGVRNDSSKYTTRPQATSVTDGEGKYFLTGLKAGSYTIKLLNEGYINFARHPLHDSNIRPIEKILTLAEGESLKDIDFSISRGGVITGQITQEDGRPLIRAYVNLSTLAKPGLHHSSVYLSPSSVHLTDDRGIYRLYRVPPGTYFVSVGDLPASDSHQPFSGFSRDRIIQTFYPGVTDESLATPIAIHENEEISGINLKIGHPVKSYSISGRVLSEDTGLPLANVSIVISRIFREGGPAIINSGCSSGPDGEFTCSRLIPGQYKIDIPPFTETVYYCDPVTVDVSDSDLSGIIIKARQGKGSISGFVELEGNSDPVLAAQLFRREVRAILKNNEGSRITTSLTSPIGSKGEFRISGLTSGKVMFDTSFQQGDPFYLQRMELNGNPVPEISITENEEVSGVRLVFSYGLGMILGKLRTRQGGLPPGITCIVVTNGISNNYYHVITSVDSHGLFRIYDIPPGEYEINASAVQNPFPDDPGKRTIFISSSKHVTVNQGSESQVEFILNLLP